MLSRCLPSSPSEDKISGKIAGRWSLKIANRETDPVKERRTLHIYNDAGRQDAHFEDAARAGS